MTDHRNDMINR